MDDERVAAFVRLETEAERRGTEPSTLGGDAEVTRQREREPGLDRETFMVTLRERIEGATERLVGDAKRLS